MKEVTSIPNAGRTFEALRSLGYDLNSAIADVIDNSITSRVKAKNVYIDFFINTDNEISCKIADDGCGMTESELQEAMRIGADSIYDEGDLGKFGMGMKTASLSNCNILTVISKTKYNDWSALRWDIGHIKNNGWSLLQLNSSEIKTLININNFSNRTQGTIVLWDDLYWINKEYKSYNLQKFAYNFYYRLLNNLKLHLRMVFHRYLDGRLKEEDSVKIYLNNESLTPWDPFCRQEEFTEQIQLKNTLSTLSIQGYNTPIKIESYIVPTKEKFSSEEAWKEAKGLLSWNDSQGYYIYRANRIIRFGGWQGTKAKDEHDKLARISIDIDSSLDELFRITVNKNKIQFPEMLYQHLKNLVNPTVVKKAKSKYNKSPETLKVNNNFRKNSSVVKQVSKNLLDDNKITTQTNSDTKDEIVNVINPTGTWLSNKISEFLKYGTENDYEIISDHLGNQNLWKIICHPNDKFKVIINASHPFYKHVYSNGTNKNLTAAIEAFIFSLAFSELYNKNDQNAHLFETYKTVCSQALEKLIIEKAI